MLPMAWICAICNLYRRYWDDETFANLFMFFFGYAIQLKMTQNSSSIFYMERRQCQVFGKSKRPPWLMSDLTLKQCIDCHVYHKYKELQMFYGLSKGLFSCDIGLKLAQNLFSPWKEDKFGFLGRVNNPHEWLDNWRGGKALFVMSIRSAKASPRVFSVVI